MGVCICLLGFRPIGIELWFNTGKEEEVLPEVEQGAMHVESYVQAVMVRFLQRAEWSLIDNDTSPIGSL